MNQARLQRNLMYLAAIADSQPQPPTMPGQQGGHYMQTPHPQQQQMEAHSSLLYVQQQPYAALQQQQQQPTRHASSGLHMLQSEASNVGGGGATIGSGGFPDFIRSSEGLQLHGGRGMIGSSLVVIRARQ